METLQKIIPIELKSDESARLSWQGTYYALQAAIVLPKQVTTEQEALDDAHALTLAIRLVPFRSQLRTKFLATLGGDAALANASNERVTVFGLLVKVNLESGEVLEVSDVRKMESIPASEAYAFNPELSVPVVLGAEQAAALKASLAPPLEKGLLEALRQPFASFLPRTTSLWKTMPLEANRADRMVPYQALFPQSLLIERTVDGTRYVVDDLYCTKPGCPCSDVTCVVLKLDTALGQEVAYGGFSYNVETQKLKQLPQFPGKFNAQEWFKQFSKNSPFDLNLLLRTRHRFMRTDFIAERRTKRAPATKASLSP